MSEDDAPPKSAYELAMERLTAADREKGIETRPLTDAQKEEIAALRQKAKAGLAELEILRTESIAEAAGDVQKLAQIEEHYEVDRKRIESRLEDDVARIKARD
ncbi:MAG: hypothetical protein GTN89_05260 [Acidobacteria bacterium]|nr:hypothetical protein [Acidobacteriota bacterium]NIM61136.1 hypothetical protein [Acidobacteriota bacterium]NIO58726.1 hypothetical protein [Acidobacteriota bacterium]NIQ29777.1 hypothetical protein [Acidobacteriota bacterium]NIQ84497.1 hypothetical protein [Acidobacteriota bacterium]